MFFRLLSNTELFFTFLRTAKKGGQKSKMRRTYDVLNILQVAKVFTMDADKRYTYNPEILDYKDEAITQIDQNQFREK